MRQIEVDIDVFAEIWRRRDLGETNENSIIRRILGLDAQEEVIINSTVGSPLPNNSKSPMSADDHTILEVLSSNFEAGKLIDQGGDGVTLGAKTGKIRWVDDIYNSLKVLGGTAPLSQIYNHVKETRKKNGRTCPPTAEAVIRRTLEDHSSDSANWRSDDLFKLVGRGEWSLRS